MCPQIFHRQMEAGAWGITVATASQALVCLHFGIPRVLIAIQLTGGGNLRAVAAAMRENPETELYCLVDSVEGVDQLATGWKQAGVGEPLHVLLEFGRAGWRTGVRSRSAADEVRRAIARYESVLDFRGVEAFEGIASNTDEADDFLAWMKQAASVYADGSSQPLVFSVGGSAYLGPVARALKKLPTAWMPLLRSGCYVTHDHGFYDDIQRAALVSAEPGEVPEFLPALELWAYVQSRPDPEMAILTFGKRDCPYDLSLPVALDFQNARVSRLNDQHAFLACDDKLPLRVGDMVRLRNFAPLHGLRQMADHSHCE